MNSDLVKTFIHEVVLTSDEVAIVNQFGGFVELWALDYSNCSAFTTNPLKPTAPPKNFFAEWYVRVTPECSGRPYQYNYFRGFMATIMYTDWTMGFPIEITVNTAWPQEPIPCPHLLYGTLTLQ
jgi:hypothetical protein